MVLNFESAKFSRQENVEENLHPKNIASNENITTKMKIDETTIDDEKENTCNGNGILEKPIAKMIESSETSTEGREDDMNDSGNSDPPEVGDLLMVDPNTSRHEEENGIHNGSKADDSTSVSSSSSNFPLADFQQDDLSDEEITLRVSDDEDISEQINNEPDSYFTSSPFPKQDDHKKTDETPPSIPAEDNNSDFNAPKLKELENSDSENKNTSEQSDSNKQTEVSHDNKNISLESSDKSDDLETFISDLPEESKSALKTETDKVTITELREEIEEFIKSHGNEEMETKKDSNENESIETENKETENEETTENTNEISDEIVDKNVEQVSEDTENKIKIIAVTENVTEETTTTENTEQTTNDPLKTTDTDETIATDDCENKLETKETDSFSCQISNVSEIVEPEKPDTSETETHTDKIEEDIIEIVPVESITTSSEENQNSDNKIEEDETETESLLMEVNESEIVENNKEESDESILIDDDVEMNEDFESKELKSEDKPIVESEDKEIKDGDIKEIKIKADDAKEEIKGEDPKSDEARGSLKRSLDISDESHDPKKAKINGVRNPDDPHIRMDAFRDFMSRKKIATLTRAELEHFCLQKMCEAITQTSKIGELNRKIMQQETRHEALQAKYTALTKQIRDLEVVHTRVLQEVRMKVKENNVEVTPVKITRSVGLQVSLQLVVGGRNRQPPPQIQTQTQAPTSPPVAHAPQVWTKRKAPQRIPPTPSTSSISMPPPSKPPLRSPQQKGIKTILPKVSPQQKTYPPAEKPKDPNNPSVLETYLQSPTPSTSKTSPPARKPTAGPSGSSDSAAKVIDLTDEDDTQKASTSTATSTSGSAIRVVSPQQLQSSTSTAVTSTSLPRLTYLVQGNTPGQQVLLATSTAPTRPGQVRSTLMFKPVAPVQGQRLNLVRPGAVPGVTVLSQASSAIRPGQQIRFTTPVQTTARPQVRAAAPLRHPAPLPGPPPMQPSQPTWKAMPPKPTLKISRVGDGIVLSWRMQNNKDMSLYEDIGSYQLYAYQETNSPPSTDMWRKVGDVKALALPMACTLTQFTDGNKYHFAVRAVDVKSRVGPFSQPEQIALP